MKRVATLLVLALIAVAGCENQELMDCRNNLAAAQKELTDQKDATETMVNLAMSGAKEFQQQLEAEKAAHEMTKTQLAQAQSHNEQSQDIQKQINTLKSENAALKDQLEQSKQMMKATAELIKEQAEAQKAENAALREANKKLTEEMKTLKTPPAPMPAPTPQQ